MTLLTKFVSIAQRQSKWLLTIRSKVRILVGTLNVSGKVGTSTAVANVRLGVGSNPTMKHLPPRRDRYVRCRAEEVVKKYP